MKITKLAFKGHSSLARISDHGFQVATIGVYHATGVPFPEGFFAVGDNTGYLWSLLSFAEQDLKGKDSERMKESVMREKPS